MLAKFAKLGLPMKGVKGSKRRGPLLPGGPHLGERPLVFYYFPKGRGVSFARRVLSRKVIGEKVQ